MKKCFDAGTIQAFLDGELAANAQETVARHVAVCDRCALALAETEEETAFAFAALGREFDGALVPTNRLWKKINRSIERETSKSVWQTALATFKNLLAKPAFAAFAGLFIVCAIFLAVRDSETNGDENIVSQKNEANKQIFSPKQTNDSQNLPVEQNPPRIENVAAKNSSRVKRAGDFRAVKTNSVKEKDARAVNRNERVKSAAPKNAAPEFVADEQAFIKTIATLEKTVNDRKDEVLKPAARFSFEKDLAVADDAILRMKREFRQNPKDAAVKQILLSSYQNKVDLLSSVAEKTELMASLK